MILTEILCFNLHAQAPNYCPARWSVCVCILCCACVCVCKQWCTVFHSWINPGQCLRGLQVNVAYFKRLFLHGHSVSEAHLHTNAFWDKDKSQQGKKPPDVVYAFVCLFFVFFHFVQPANVPFVSTFLSFACFISFSLTTISSSFRLVSPDFTNATWGCLMPVTTVNSSNSEWMWHFFSLMAYHHSST